MNFAFTHTTAIAISRSKSITGTLDYEKSFHITRSGVYRMDS